ncbi:MAG TPA: MOSC domain-containing protein [Rhodothermales bacterium]|nr:MOSC domain-containing protein [Rhodothermales bacterium]
MQVVSVNLGSPQSLDIGKKTVETGIFKRPVQEQVMISEQGVHGDTVANKIHHGGPDQAVYLYSLEDYDWWSQTLDKHLIPGTFGENLTLSQFGAPSLKIGDRFQINDALLEVTAARIPCAKLAARMGDPGFVKRFVQARRPGVYARVLEPGTVAAGDAVTFVPTPRPYPEVVAIFDLWHSKERDPARLEAGLVAPLAERARAAFMHWLEQA